MKPRGRESGVIARYRTLGAALVCSIKAKTAGMSTYAVDLSVSGVDAAFRPMANRRVETPEAADCPVTPFIFLPHLAAGISALGVSTSLKPSRMKEPA